MTEKCRLIKISEVLTIVPVSDSTLRRMVNAGEFPKPIKLGSNVLFWSEDEIHSWIGGQLASRGGDSDELI